MSITFGIHFFTMPLYFGITLGSEKHRAVVRVYFSIAVSPKRKKPRALGSE
jgi:hypothetical protein